MNFADPAKRLLFFAAVAAGGYGAVIFLALAYFKFQYPYMVGLGEPALSEAIRSIAQGALPYRELSSPPYTLVPYGPVYLGLAAIAGHGFKLVFTGGRIVAFLATAGCSALIYFISRREGVKKSFSILAALIFVSMPYVREWGVMANVDMTGTFLDLAAFTAWWYCAASDGRSQKLFVGGTLLSTAAFFTKSSMIAAPAAFFCFLLFQKQFKKAFFLFSFQAILAGLIYIYLDQATRGNYFFHTAYEISRRNFYFEFILRFWGSALSRAPFLAAAGLFALWRGLRGGRKLFFSLYVFFVLALTASLGKQGSDTNYFLPWIAASSVAAGMMLQDLSGRRPAWAQAAVCALLLGQLCFWVYPDRDPVRAQKSYQSAREFFDNISGFIQKIDGDILSEDMSLLVANDRRIFYEPFPMGQMSHNGVWDEELILKELDRQRFPLAILYFYAPLVQRSRTFTLEFMKKFNQKYRFAGRAVPPKETAGLISNPLFIYVPRKE